MIYMSIKEAIGQALSANRLTLLELEFRSDLAARMMLLHPELSRDLERAAEIPRIGRLKADLEMFVRGQEVSICMVPRKHRSAYMGLLEPVRCGTWDIRSRDPSPGIRVFGAFACCDVFVALHWVPRSRPISGFEKKPLVDDEIATQLAMIETEERWAAALPTISPVVGGSPSDYISQKFRLIAD